MSAPVLEYHSPTTHAARPHMSRWEKSFLIILGVVLPLVCFALAARDYPMEPEWQSGEWNRYIRFVPDGRAGFPFYPLLIFSMVCLCIFVARPLSSTRLVIRAGLFTGIILALQYAAIQSLAADHYAPVAFGIGLASNFILLGILKLFEWIPKRVLIYSATGIGLLILFAAIVLGIGGFYAIAPLSHAIFQWPIAIGLACLILAPAWCAGAYTRAALLALRLNRSTDQKRAPLIYFTAWISWLGGYAIAWKWSITNAMALYAALPASAPGCYIATAAATGHPRFVGSSAAHALNGSSYQVNQQLRRLKAFEIALEAVCPRTHRVVRGAYNFIGPPLATIIALHPLIADIAYAALKPIEWVTFGLLIAIAPGVRGSINRFYSPCVRGCSC